MEFRDSENLGGNMVLELPDAENLDRGSSSLAVKASVKAVWRSPGKSKTSAGAVVCSSGAAKILAGIRGLELRDVENLCRSYFLRRWDANNGVRGVFF